MEQIKEIYNVCPKCDSRNARRLDEIRHLKRKDVWSLKCNDCGQNFKIIMSRE